MAQNVALQKKTRAQSDLAFLVLAGSISTFFGLFFDKAHVILHSQQADLKRNRISQKTVQKQESFPTLCRSPYWQKSNEINRIVKPRSGAEPDE